MMWMGWRMGAGKRWAPNGRSLSDVALTFASPCVRSLGFDAKEGDASAV